METKCDYCNKMFSILPVDIKTIKINLDNEEYLLKYFMCPNCDSIYKILLLTMSDIQIQYDMLQSKEKYMEALKQNHVLARIYYTEYLEKKKTFDRVVQITNYKYSGRFIFDKERNEIIYREKEPRKKRRM
jgi:hypothetical protein